MKAETIEKIKPAAVRRWKKWIRKYYPDKTDWNDEKPLDDYLDDLYEKYHTCGDIRSNHIVTILMEEWLLPKTYEDLGLVLGVSIARAKQITDRMMRDIKSYYIAADEINNPRTDINMTIKEFAMYKCHNTRLRHTLLRGIKDSGLTLTKTVKDLTETPYCKLIKIRNFGPVMYDKLDVIIRDEFGLHLEPIPPEVK